jgi:hypothetical protein
VEAGTVPLPGRAFGILPAFHQEIVPGRLDVHPGGHLDLSIDPLFAELLDGPAEKAACRCIRIDIAPVVARDEQSIPGAIEDRPRSTQFGSKLVQLFE